MEDTPQNNVVELICAECGNGADNGLIFCNHCGATLRQTIPLVPSVAPDIKRSPLGKRILRGIVKTIAAAAGLVFVFDNRASGIAGIVLLASVAVLFLCLFVWLIFDLGEGDGFWPKKPDW